MSKKCVIFKVDIDSQKEIISFLSIKEFIAYTFLVSKKLTKNYEDLIYHTVRNYLLSSWNIQDDDIIFQFLQNIFTKPLLTNKQHVNDCSIAIKIKILKSLLFKSYSVLESYRAGNPEFIHVYEIKYSRANRSTVAASISKYIPNNSNTNSNANTSKIIQYTGPIGVGNRSIMLYQPCPVKVDRMKELSDEINQIYQQSMRINLNFNTFTSSQTSSSEGTLAMNNGMNPPSSATLSANYNTSSGTFLPRLSLSSLPSMLAIPASISMESFLATAKVLNKLYKALKKSAASNGTDKFCTYPCFSTPYVCKNSRYSECLATAEDPSHEPSEAVHNLTTVQGVAGCVQAVSTSAAIAADVSACLSTDCKLIASCAIRSVTYFEVSIKSYLPLNRSSNFNLQSLSFASATSATGGVGLSGSMSRVRSSRSLQSLAQYFSSNTTSASPSPTSGVDCVAVGLATDNFDNHFKFPGWDSESYGYHGDDGAIFHGDGHQLTLYDPSFGPGDTIGCGLNYLDNTIFFTLNGVYLGTAFENINTSVAYYPTLGIDCSNPIEVNFGNKKPFEFDLYHFIESTAGAGAARSGHNGMSRAKGINA